MESLTRRVCVCVHCVHSLSNPSNPEALRGCQSRGGGGSERMCVERGAKGMRQRRRRGAAVPENDRESLRRFVLSREDRQTDSVQ